MNQLSKVDVILTKPTIRFLDFEKLKNEALQVAKKIDEIELTDENIKEVKKILATVNKSVKELNDRRIIIKKEILEPYERFADQIKQIESIVKTSDEAIRNQVRELEERERQDKKAKIEEIWKKRIRLYNLSKIFEFEDWIENKHLNKSEAMKKVEQDMVNFLEQTERDLQVLSTMDNSDQLIDQYKQTRDVALSIQLMREEKERIEQQQKLLEKVVVQKEKDFAFIVTGDKDKKMVELLLKENDKDLLEKLKKGMEDTNNGKVCSVEEAYEEVKEILAN